jgi:hypothetical protein
MLTIALSLLLLCVTTVAGSVPNASSELPAIDYSADRIIEGPGGTLGGKFYSSLDKERIETNTNGTLSIVILRRDMQGGYLLMPEQKKYQGIRLRSAQKMSYTPSLDQMDLIPVGVDVIDGDPTTKWRAALKDGSAEGFVWLTRDRIPVKMELASGSGPSAQRVTIVLKNIVRGAQSPALFELPGGYGSIPSPGAMGMSGGSTIW